MANKKNTDKQKYEQQNEQLREMDYAPNEDIFAHEKHIRLDENGEPVYDENLDDYDMEMGLDVPGSDYDNQQEEIGSEDEENNYWSISDNEDDHEEINEDLVE
ncbi:hypothetical protein K5I29_06385 [Flavobacterium agricola]|uniref:Uncharacterized protein n=1 Tax=Flavobacterium agricola TaxID=2870839 RepID=A0ABY6M4F4_9FLAO|nr:hypothetical protein [Flavobacterium agricola]UYW02503.1 hypothetical protein K5I29_06385 [Flavobacterium agricola]